MQIQVVEPPKLRQPRDSWQRVAVAAAIAAGTAVEIRGNAVAGWGAYIVGADDGYDEPVSPFYSPDVDETVEQCIAECQFVYGVRLPHNRKSSLNERPLRVIEVVEL